VPIFVDHKTGDIAVLNIWIQAIAALLLLPCSMQAQGGWSTFRSTAYAVAFDHPPSAKIRVMRFEGGDSLLILEIHSADSVMPTFGNLLGKGVIVHADLKLTKFDFDHAAVDWGFTKKAHHWLIRANPGVGPSTRATVIRKGRITILKGNQVFGQQSTEGFAEIARVPLQFVFLRGGPKGNIVMSVLYDSLATNTLTQIIKSMKVIDEKPVK
jgi:hypothetical protein